MINTIIYKDFNKAINKHIFYLKTQLQSFVSKMTHCIKNYNYHCSGMTFKWFDLKI